jgi:hypothetical protein
MSEPSQSEYGCLAIAFDHFNCVLFSGHLPPVLITLNHRSINVLGYYHDQRFSLRTTDRIHAPRVSEISLNPKSMEGRSDMEVLSTLVHEMVHLWQFASASPSRGGYHNREWADKMESIGLVPSNTGLPGGKRTGQQMTHYIIPDGPFEKVCRALLQHGWRLDWHVPSEYAKKLAAGGLTKGTANASKTRFTCAKCTQNAWAKPGAKLVCGYCNIPMDKSEAR